MQPVKCSSSGREWFWAIPTQPTCSTQSWAYDPKWWYQRRVVPWVVDFEIAKNQWFVRYLVEMKKWNVWWTWRSTSLPVGTRKLALSSRPWLNQPSINCKWWQMPCESFFMKQQKEAKDFKLPGVKSLVNILSRSLTSDPFSRIHRWDHFANERIPIVLPGQRSK